MEIYQEFLFRNGTWRQSVSSPGGPHAERGAVLLALVGEHLLDAADLDVGEVAADVGDERVHAAPVQRRLGGARLLPRARPALPRHRARRQLDGREQRRRQPARHLPVVAPLHAAQELFSNLYALTQLYLKDNVQMLSLIPDDVGFQIQQKLSNK